jgi:alcohol dehydrogenase class IV
MQFEFATAQRIIFGRGVIQRLPDLVAAYGRKVLLVSGKHSLGFGLTLLHPNNGRELATIITSGEPDLDFIQSGLAYMSSIKPDVIVSLGGGSTLDTGKALAALYTNPGDVLDYVEVVGKGLPLQNDPLPHIAISTTSGTGSEVTRNAVLGIAAQKAKVSLRSKKMIPTIALVDPDLNRTLPTDLTAATGLDALTQVIEPLISRRANPITDAFCLQAIPLIMQSLPLLMRTPEDMVLREQMSLASLYGGLALANSGLGVVHGFAAAIGGMYKDIRHSNICAAVLPAGFKANRLACQRSTEHMSIAGRIEAISLLLTNGNSKYGEEALRELVNRLGCPGLASLGVKWDDAAEIIERVAQSSSFRANPVELSQETLTAILAESM